MECIEFGLRLDDLLDGGSTPSGASRSRSTWSAARNVATGMRKRWRCWSPCASLPRPLRTRAS